MAVRSAPPRPRRELVGAALHLRRAGAVDVGRGRLSGANDVHVGIDAVAAALQARRAAAQAACDG